MPTIKKTPFFPLSLLSISLLGSYSLVHAGLDAPAESSDPGSAMHTLKDICQRLDNGATGSKRAGGFTEPTSGPTDTDCSLDEVMAKAPALDNTNGVSAAEVTKDKTFWGLTPSGWGLQTGTLSAQNLSDANDTVGAGIYSATTLSTVDSDLQSANIKSGVTVFGIAGDTNVVDTSGGDATANEIASGKKVYVGGNLVTGTVPPGNNVTGTNGNLSMAIPDGLYSGGKTATAIDSNLIADNIKSGASIFGVSGNYTGLGGGVVNTNSGDAAAGEILSGKKAWVDGVEVTGSMTDRGAVDITPGTSDQTILAGYHNGSGKVTGDADLIAANIVKDKEIFGVTGSALVASGDATAGDVLAGKTFSNDSGVDISGTMIVRDGDNASTGQSAASGINKLTAPAGYYDGDDTVTATDAQIAALDTDITAENIKKDVVVFGVTGTAETGGSGGTSGGTIQVAPTEPTINPRFTINMQSDGVTPDGTVTDNLTGLIWLKNANCAGATLNLANALSAISKLNTEGTMNTKDCGISNIQTGWRLPNINELLSLVNYKYSSPPISNISGDAKWSSAEGPFSSLQIGSRYWSSTGDAGRPNYGWTINTTRGETFNLANTSKFYVWPVRD